MTIEEFKQSFPKKYPRTSSFTSGIALMAVDCMTIMFCICFCFFIVNAVDHSLINFRSSITYAIYLPLILIVFYAANLYPGIMLDPAEEVRHLSMCSTFSFIGIALSITVESDDRIPIVIALLLACPCAAILLPGIREVARHGFAKRNWWGVPAVIYTTGNNGDFVVNRLIRHPHYGYKPALIVNSDTNCAKEFEGIPVFPKTPELDKILKDLNIKVAIFCDYEKEDITKIIQEFRYTIFIPKKQPIFGNMKARELGSILGYSVTHNLKKPECNLAKRFIDISLILLSSPLVIPLTIIIGIAVKLTSKGPVFYGHKRVGQNGKEIKCWKFRSMVINADQMLDKILKDNPAMAAEWEKDRKFTNDPRVTKLGKFLRRTSLDEIPQLWNIFCGEMSIVGPRPVTTAELDKYGDNSKFILSVQPGLSGMWQISGRSDTSYEERVTLDSYYILNWSVWLDIWIIIKTVWVVIKGKGAY